jgi:hypothetical protein
MATKKTADKKTPTKIVVREKAEIKKAPATTKVARKATAEKSAKSTVTTKSRAANSTRKPRLSRALTDTSEQVTTVDCRQANINLAFQKPDWQNQQVQLTRPLWQIAALAFDIAPNPKVTAEWKKLLPDESKKYSALVTAMSDTLLPTHQAGHIYFDETSPANRSRLTNKKDLKFIRVEAASAIAFVVEKFSMKLKLPAEFRDLNEHLKKSAPIALERENQVTQQLTQIPGRQDKAIEKKTSTSLLKLVYVIVEHEYGWAGLSSEEHEKTLDTIIKALSQHAAGSVYGLSKEKIEEYIINGKKLAKKI